MSGLANASSWGSWPSGSGAGAYSGGSPFSAGAYGGTGFARSATGINLPVNSFSAGNPGQVGPTWAPGQRLLSPSSQPTTTPPGFGSPAPPPLVTPLPPSVLSPASATPSPPSAPAAPAVPTGMIYSPQALQEAAAGGYDPGIFNAYAAGGWVVDPRNRGALAALSRGSRHAEPPRRAYGGLGVAPSPEQMGMLDIRRSTNELYHPGGFLESPVAGRTDHLPLAIAPDSHVIPADVVSGIGEGNSLNGAHLLDQMFHGGPWGVRAAKLRAPGSLPRPPRPMERSRGGAALAAGDAPERTTPILAAGGEYVVRPEAVAHFGAIAKRRDPRRFARKSATEAGHDAIDDFIVRARKHIVATTKKLPGPVKE